MLSLQLATELPKRGVMFRNCAKLNLRIFTRVGLTLFFCLLTSLAFAANSSPQVGTVTPSSGSSQPNQQVIFTTTYTDPDGWQNLAETRFLINYYIDGRNCVYLRYDQNTNKLYLCKDNDLNEATRWLGGFLPGSANIIENSYGKLDCSKTTVSGSGNTLTLKWAVTFKPTFTGAKNTYLRVRDDLDVYAGWTQKGTWAIENINHPPVLNPIGNKNVFVSSAEQTDDDIEPLSSNMLSNASTSLKVQKLSSKEEILKFKPGEIIINFKSDVLDIPEGKRIALVNEIKIGADSIEALNKKFGLLRVERIFKSGDKKRLQLKWQDLRNTYLFTFPTDSDIEAIVKEYKNDPNVKFVEPNYLMKIMEQRKLPSNKYPFKSYK